MSYADFEDPERFVDPTTYEPREDASVIRHVTAQQITFEGDEDGWHMRVDTGDELIDVYVHGIAFELVDAVDRTIGEWQREGERARHGPAPLTEEDLEAYPPGDPKRITLERQLRGES